MGAILSSVPMSPYVNSLYATSSAVCCSILSLNLLVNASKLSALKFLCPADSDFLYCFLSCNSTTASLWSNVKLPMNAYITSTVSMLSV